MPELAILIVNSYMMSYKSRKLDLARDRVEMKHMCYANKSKLLEQAKGQIGYCTRVVKVKGAE